MKESDSSYRDRIIEKVPEGHVYTAEELADASGDALDAIGESYGVKRNI